MNRRFLALAAALLPAAWAARFAKSKPTLQTFSLGFQTSADYFASSTEWHMTSEGPARFTDVGTLEFWNDHHPAVKLKLDDWYGVHGKDVSE